MAKRNAKEEKRLRNEEYAKKFRVSDEARSRRSKKELDKCGVVGHEDHDFNDCPDWK